MLLMIHQLFQIVKPLTGSDLLWRVAQYAPSHYDGSVVLLHVVYETARMIVPAIYPCAAFHLYGYSLLRPSQIKAPSPNRVEAIFGNGKR